MGSVHRKYIKRQPKVVSRIPIDIGPIDIPNIPVAPSNPKLCFSAQNTFH